MYFHGPGGVGKSALPCFATNLDTAVWLFPNMTVVTMETPPPTPNAIISFKQTFASYTAVIVKDVSQINREWSRGDAACQRERIN